MPRVSYSNAAKFEAIALGRLLGIDAAAKQLHLDRRTLRRWSEEAGDAPELIGETGQLRRIRDAAYARVESLLGSGRLSAVQAATVGAIASRNIRDAERREQASTKQTDEVSDVRQAVDEFEAHMATIYPGVGLTVILQVLLEHDRLTETADPSGDDAPVDTRDGQAVFDEWLATLATLVEEHGSIDAARQWQRDEASRRLEVQLAKNAAVRDAAIESARVARLDAETRSLLAAAEAFLRESSDG